MQVRESSPCESSDTRQEAVTTFHLNLCCTAVEDKVNAYGIKQGGNAVMGPCMYIKLLVFVSGPFLVLTNPESSYD